MTFNPSPPGRRGRVLVAALVALLAVAELLVLVAVLAAIAGRWPTATVALVGRQAVLWVVRQLVGRLRPDRDQGEAQPPGEAPGGYAQFPARTQARTDQARTERGQLGDR